MVDEREDNLAWTVEEVEDEFQSWPWDHLYMEAIFCLSSGKKFCRNHEEPAFHPLSLRHIRRTMMTLKKTAQISYCGKHSDFSPQRQQFWWVHYVCINATLTTGCFHLMNDHNMGSNVSPILWDSGLFKVYLLLKNSHFHGPSFLRYAQPFKPTSLPSFLFLLHHSSELPYSMTISPTNLWYVCSYLGIYFAENPK